MQNLTMMVETLMENKWIKYLIYSCVGLVILAVGYPILQLVYEIAYDLGRSIGYWLY